MLNKKIILPIAAFAMASFVACGDDSSSSGPAASSNPANNSNVPASVQTLEEAINLACSSTENMCAKVYVEEDADTVQCDGTIFTPMMLGKPVDGCKNKASADTPADSENKTPAAEEPAGDEKQPVGENPGAGKEPANQGGDEETVDLGGGAGEEGAEPGAGKEPAGPGAGEEPAGPGAGEQSAE